MERVKDYLKSVYQVVGIIFILVAVVVVLGISSFQSNNNVYKTPQQSKASEIGNTYYVSSVNGDDLNTGTVDSPYKTITKCISRVVSGDTCSLRGGTYYEFVIINKSGASGSPITITNYQNEKPIIDGQNVRATIKTVNPSGSSVGFININGLIFTNSNNYAFESVGSHDISVANCEASYSYNGGLVFRNGSNILVDNCNVHHTNQAGTGASHEAISIANIKGYEIKNSQVHDGGEEGITVKQGSMNGKIHHNKVYSNRGPNLYLGGFFFLDVYNNDISSATATDKSNIGLNVESCCGNSSDISIYNNIIRNSIAGIGFWVESGTINPSIDRIKIYNNLFYSNGTRGALKFASSLTYFHELDIKNNIFWKNSYSVTGATIANTIASNNIFDINGFGENQIITSSVNFIDEVNKNFHPGSNSPSIDRGTTVGINVDYDGASRPQGISYDVGPYEFLATAPTSISTPTTVPTNAPTSIPTPTLTAVDTTAPVIIVSSPVAGSITTSRKININTSASDASKISQILIYIDGSTTVYKTCLNTPSCSTSVGNLKLGLHSVRVRVYDNSINKNWKEVSISFIKK